MVSNENKIKFLQKNKNKNELFQIVKKQAKKYKGYSKMKKLDLINLIVNNKNDFLAIHQEIDPDSKLDEKKNDNKKTLIQNETSEIKKAEKELNKLNKIKNKTQEHKDEIEELEEYIKELKEELTK